MSGVSYSIKFDDSKLKTLTRELMPRAQRIINKTAINIQGGATQNTVRVDTGNMKNGWQVELAGGGVEAAKTDAVQRRVALPKGDELTAIIGNVMEYAFYQEMGTERLSASPMLGPAIEARRPGAEEAWRALFDERA